MLSLPTFVDGEHARCVPRQSRYCVFSLRLMYLLDFNTENIDGQKLILYLKQGIEMACLTPMCSVCHMLVFL